MKVIEGTENQRAEGERTNTWRAHAHLHLEGLAQTSDRDSNLFIPRSLGFLMFQPNCTFRTLPAFPNLELI